MPKEYDIYSEIKLRWEAIEHAVNEKDVVGVVYHCSKLMVLHSELCGSQFPTIK